MDEEGRRGERTPAARPCSFEMSDWLVCHTRQSDWLTDRNCAGPREAARWPLLISKAFLAYINKCSPLRVISNTQGPTGSGNKTSECGVVRLVCLHFITRKVRRKPFNIVTSRLLKPTEHLLTSPFQVLARLSTFKTVRIVSLSVIVSSVIRQSFSSTLCRYFSIV